jgi:hypothetical protein
LGGYEVTGVEHEVGTRDQPHALLGQGARPAREMRVGDDGDAGQEAATGSDTTVLGSRTNCPAFHTSSPSA